MNVGLPGTGIGGMFYLISAFAMVIIEAYLLIRGRSNKKRLSVVGKQILIAWGILAGVAVTGWFLGFIFQTIREKAPIIAQKAGVATNSYQLTVSPFALSLSVLLFVVLSVEIIGLVSLFRKKRIAQTA